MARTKRWTHEYGGVSVTVVHLSNWAYFDDYIRQEMLDYREFIWRGQCAAHWPLEPTLDRILRRKQQLQNKRARVEHLGKFKLSSRGRRGAHPPQLASDNDWWALGQHFGLATPLLDWTTSPFVAAYFAFYAEENDNADRRAVWGLAKYAAENRSAEIAAGWKSPGRPSVVEFVEPLSDENARLVSQGGLFTRAPDGVTIEDWVHANFPADKYYCLSKITIPNADRAVALRSLNRMNINHLSLFPDLYGASKFVNLDLLIDKY